MPAKWAGLYSAQPVSRLSQFILPSFPQPLCGGCGSPILQMEEWALKLVSSSQAYKQSFTLGLEALRVCSSPFPAVLAGRRG